jgi:hypothetical protein
MDYVIGDAIRKKIEEKGMTFVAFSDKFGVTDRNLQYLFKKSDLTLQQVVRASEILEYDFMTEYLRNKKPKYKSHQSNPVVEEERTTYKSEKITMSLQVAGDISNYSTNFPDFIKSISREAEKFGFQVL